MTEGINAYPLSVLDDVAWVETGRAIGHDLARFNLNLGDALAPACVIEGFSERRSKHGKPEPSTRFERKWVRLRLNAFLRQRTAATGLTPAFLEAIDVAECPVLRIKLTHSTRRPTDWSVDRLNNDGAYAPGNLAVISTLANTAKSARGFNEVLARANQPDPTEGLSPPEWMRLACLMLGPCFAHAPARAPILPLVTPIPKYTVRTAMQHIQYALTLQAVSQSGKNTLIKQFGLASQSERSKACFMFLAEAVHQGLKRCHTPWDVWLEAPTMRKLIEWRDTLEEPAWALAGEIARQLNGALKVGPSRLKPWMLASRGYRPA